MEEKILELIKKKGLDKTAQLFGKTVLGLYKDFQLPITDNSILYQLCLEIINHPDYESNYNEYVIKVDMFDFVVEWNDYEYSNDNGEDISMSFYCTPFYEGIYGIPIQLEQVMRFMGGTDYDRISDYFDDDYSDIIKLNDKVFNDIFDLIDWMNNDYLELVYNKLTEIREKIINVEIKGLDYE